MPSLASIPLAVRALAAFFLGILLLGGILIARRAKPETPPAVQIPAVAVASLAELSSSLSPLVLTGSVRSLREATVAAESSGRVTRVYRSLGDAVPAGALLLELENGRERAAVASAEASLASAEASRSISIVATKNAEDALATTLAGARNTLRSVYVVLEDAVRRKADPAFTDPESPAPRFRPTVTDPNLATSLEAGRPPLSGILARERDASASLGGIATAEDVREEIERATEEAAAIKRFLDTLVEALGKAVAAGGITADDIDGYAADAATARANAASALKDLTAALESVNAKEAALETALRGFGAPGETTAGSAVESARAALETALANLEKTRVRSPIAGTVNTLEADEGDYLAAGAPVATIANNRALEVISYVAATDRTSIRVGAPVLVAGAIRGSVTRIAPGLDPALKKIEIRIGLEDSGGLLHGQSVRVAIERVNGPAGPLLVPVSAVKITSEGPILLTLSGEILAAVPVTLGPIVGDKIVIAGGATPDLPIVVDARGRSASEKVRVLPR